MLNKLKKTLTNKRTILTLSTLLVVLLIAKNTIFAKKTPPETSTVTRGTLEEKLTISGKISASEDAVLSFQTGGQLSWVGVKVGDKVRKYQSIASLDQRQVKKSIQKYLNTYEKTRDSFENSQDTYKDKTLWTDPIRRILHGSQMDLSNSVLDVEVADLTRQFANLWSPINGIVVRADALYPGTNISPLTTIYEIVNPETIYFSISADQNEVTKLKVGLSGTLTLDSYPDQEITGSISRVSFSPDPTVSDTLYKADFRIDTTSEIDPFRLGMTGDVTFTTNSVDDALYLPSKFIRSDGTEKFVLRLTGTKKEKVSLQTGLETDDFTEIKSGLKEGDTVVLEK